MRYARELLLFAAYSASIVGILLIPGLLLPSAKGVFFWGETNAIKAAAALLLVWLFNNRFCGKDLRYAGLRWDRASGADLAVGLAFGAAMIGSVFGMLLLVGGLRVTWRHPSAEMLWLVPVLIGIQGLQVCAEELLFRTFILRRLSEWMPVWSASLLWGGFFGFLHLLGGGNTAASIVGIVAAGIMLNLAYFVAGGSVWLPFGIHLAWNALQMHVFFSRRLFEVDYSGPAWLNGGGDPEASLISVAVVSIAALAMAWRLRAGYSARARVS